MTPGTCSRHGIYEGLCKECVTPPQGPREWTLFWGQHVNGPGLDLTEEVNVIEKSAYDAVVKERDNLERALAFAKCSIKCGEHEGVIEAVERLERGEG